MSGISAGAIKWAYAINQWKPQFDDFVRREQHERALKTISIAGFGVRLTCHHEFFCGIQSEPDIDTFYSYTDPQYVSLFVDTAQHCIAGLDPVALYNRHAHRVSGFHFKDTRNVATGDDHRHRPDSEIMAPTTGKWFYEMGTPQGLVDFEAMMTAVRDNGYTGWISVEHDKANKEGGDYSESTAISRWYAKNVLEEIYK
jgi:inosose dehydratase